MVPGSKAEEAVKLMDEIPRIMEKLTESYKEEQTFKTIFEMIQEKGIEDPVIAGEVEKFYKHFSDSKRNLKEEMLNIINRLEELGHGFVVQGARESLSVLD